MTHPAVRRMPDETCLFHEPQFRARVAGATRVAVFHAGARGERPSFFGTVLMGH